ncbi:MAG: hypothetical protein Q9195_004161 [Heterodermia aff. obscurata]
MAVSTSSSPDSPDVQPSRPSGRTSLRFMHDSLQKIYPSHASSSSQVQDLQKALKDAKSLNAKHQEQIEILTLERDAAESALHTQKRISRSLEQDFSRCENSHLETSDLLHSAHDRNEAQQTALEAKNKELQAKDKQIKRLQLESSTQTSEIVSLTSEKMDLEDWISEIKTAVKAANTSYTNLESKLQTQNGIILQLKAENTRLEQRHETDVVNLEMNRKALVRSNNDLKRSCEDLQAKLQLQAEQENAKAMQPAIDWKAECLRVHKRKTTEIEALEAEKEGLQVENQEQFMELRALRTEMEQLQVENQEQYMELRTLRTGEVDFEAKTELGNSVASTARPTVDGKPADPVTSSCVSEVVTLFDVPPDEVTNDSSAGAPSLLPAETLAFSDLAGAIVFLSCLLSALLLSP